MKAEVRLRIRKAKADVLIARVKREAGALCSRFPVYEASRERAPA